jgi:membrane protein implicated in regulation of membrane protease activity
MTALSGWQLVYWYWWILATVLLFIEALAPGFFFLWMAVAASLCGLLLMLFPELSWQYQMLIFAGLSVVSIVVFRFYQHAHPPRSDHPVLNRRGEQYLGRSFTLDESITNGMGSLKVDDTSWRVSSDDLPAGTKVEVIGVDGVTLRIKAVSPVDTE